MTTPRRRALTFSVAALVLISTVTYLWRHQVCDNYTQDVLVIWNEWRKDTTQPLLYDRPPWGCKDPIIPVAG